MELITLIFNAILPFLVVGTVLWVMIDMVVFFYDILKDDVLPYIKRNAMWLLPVAYVALLLVSNSYLTIGL